MAGRNLGLLYSKRWVSVGRVLDRGKRCMAEAPLRLGWLDATYSILTVLSRSSGVDANTLES